MYIKIASVIILPFSFFWIETGSELCHWTLVSGSHWEFRMPCIASLFCLHLIGQSSFYVIASYAIICLLSLCLSRENFIVSCYLNIFLLALKPKVLEESVKKKKKTEFAKFVKAFLIILYKPSISYQKKRQCTS